MNTTKELLAELDRQLVARQYTVKGRQLVRGVCTTLLSVQGRTLKATIRRGIDHVRGIHAHGGMSMGNLKSHMRWARRLEGLMEGDESIWYRIKPGPTYHLSRHYANILDNFRSILGDRPSDRSSLTAAGLFFDWLIGRGIKRIGSLTPELMLEYVAKIRSTSKGNGVNCVRSNLKRLAAFLVGKALVPATCLHAISLPVRCQKWLLPAFSPAEFRALTETIESRQDGYGRRNLAIFRIAASTGMRIGDIVGLTFSDIDWSAGEIRCVQSKTGVPIRQPLMHDVGTALRDYILNFRPTCESDKIFVTSIPPIRPMSSSTMGAAFSRTLKSCDIKKSAFDGKSLHAMRRTVGRDLVTAGVPLPTVQQILGHSSVRATSRYVALDAHGLRSCALGLDGIEPAEGGAR